MENVSRDTIVETAKKYLGCLSCKYNPDVCAIGNTEQGFTCAGFVRFVLEQSGIPIPEHIRHAREFFDYFGVPVHEEQVLPGDLVFFTRYGTYPNHMGIMVSKDEYIFSPGMRIGEVKIKKIHNTYKNNIDLDNPRVLYTKNPIGFKRIALPAGNYQDILHK